MKIRNQQEFWAGLLFVAAGSMFVIGASGFDVGNSRQPGSGYFPLLMGFVLAMLGALLNFKAVTFETDDGAPVVATNWRLTLTTFAALLLAGLLLPRVGLGATIVSVAMVLAVGAGRLCWRGWLGFSLLGGLLSRLVFGELLGQPMLWWPAGSGFVR